MNILQRKKPDKPVNDAVDDIDEVIEGKRSYSLESKLSPRLYSEQYCRNLSGHGMLLDNTPYGH